MFSHSHEGEGWWTRKQRCKAGLECCPGDVGGGSLSTHLLMAPFLHLESKSRVSRCLLYTPPCPPPPPFCIIFAPEAMISSQVAQTVKNLPAVWKTWVRSLCWEDSLEKGMATHSSILAGEFHGQRSLVGYSPRDCKESDTTEWPATHTGFFQFLLGPWLSPVILEWRMAGYLVVKRIDSLQIKKKKKKKTILGEN